MSSQVVTYRELIDFLWKFIQKQKWTFSSIFIQDCINCLDSLLWPFILRWVIDIFSQNEMHRALAWQSLQVPIIVSICLIVLIEINSRSMGFLMAKAIPKLQADIRMAMFEHVQEHSPKYFTERFAGSLVNKISDMTTSMEAIIQQLFWPIISSIAMSLLGALFLWFVHPIIAAILILWIIVHLSICFIFSRTCDQYEHRHAKELQIRAGEIIFDNVSFHYGEKKLFTNKQAHIRGGEKVGLVGFTGAGKSTFINLILRFFPLHKGKILIDGHDIADVTSESLRRQIALIPQDPLLFHRTLRENIAYGKPEATEAEIYAAAKLAHCDEFIRHIPSGYEAKVGERGTKLSGGEKQRIAIARAILMDAPILILDEATSSLDSVTEKYVQDSLEKLMQNRTTIVIAHRLSTLSRMDRILVFDHGKIVEEGTHAALMSKDGLYAKMWKMQVGGFLPLRPSPNLA